jgi:hypothetical protein
MNLNNIREEFEKLTRHEFEYCAAHGEGQYCCLDKEHERHGKVLDFTYSTLNQIIDSIELPKEESTDSIELAINSDLDYESFTAGYRQAELDLNQLKLTLKQQLGMERQNNEGR